MRVFQSSIRRRGGRARSGASCLVHFYRVHRATVNVTPRRENGYRVRRGTSVAERFRRRFRSGDGDRRRARRARLHRHAVRDAAPRRGAGATRLRRRGRAARRARRHDARRWPRPRWHDWYRSAEDGARRAARARRRQARRHRRAVAGRPARRSSWRAQPARRSGAPSACCRRRCGCRRRRCSFARFMTRLPLLAQRGAAQAGRHRHPRSRRCSGATRSRRAARGMPLRGAAPASSSSARTCATSSATSRRRRCSCTREHDHTVPFACMDAHRRIASARAEYAKVIAARAVVSRDHRSTSSASMCSPRSPTGSAATFDRRRRRMARFVVAIDQGTTGSTVLVFDETAAAARRAAIASSRSTSRSRAGSSTIPRRSGSSVLGALADALHGVGRDVDAAQVAAIGITNQRETTLRVGARDRQAAAQRHRLAGPPHRRPLRRAEGGRARGASSRAHRAGARSVLLGHQAAAGCSTTSPGCARAPSAASSASAPSTATSCGG